MGWFWADENPSSALSIASSVSRERPSSGAQCPVAHTAPSALPSSSGRCPIDHEAINPLNQMPNLSQHQISDAQGVRLPTDREISTIPKSSHGGNWEYPSAQQLYNAMVRKGYAQSGEHVESMLSVHNFLNERAWQEILEWEQLSAPQSSSSPSLVRFTGRPASLSPKAYLYSSIYGHAPFDRHDWYVDRNGREVRYVIDYYDAPNDEEGNGVFYLDIRPALDSPGAALTRIKKWTSETWAVAAGKSGAT